MEQASPGWSKSVATSTLAQAVMGRNRRMVRAAPRRIRDCANGNPAAAANSKWAANTGPEPSGSAAPAHGCIADSTVQKSAVE